MYKDFYKIISTYKVTSSFETVFESPENLMYLIGLDRRSIEYREITQKALILLSNRKEISFDGNIRLLNPKHYNSEMNSSLRKYYKAAFNLGHIFSKEDYLILFMKLGVVTI